MIAKSTWLDVVYVLPYAVAIIKYITRGSVPKIR